MAFFSFFLGKVRMSRDPGGQQLETVTDSEGKRQLKSYRDRNTVDNCLLVCDGGGGNRAALYFFTVVINEI